MNGEAPCFEQKYEGAAARANVDLNQRLNSTTLTALENQLVEDAISVPALAWDDALDLEKSHEKANVPMTGDDEDDVDERVGIVAYAGEEGGWFHDSALGLGLETAQPKSAPETCSRMGSAMICLTRKCERKLALKLGEVPVPSGDCKKAKEAEIREKIRRSA